MKLQNYRFSVYTHNITIDDGKLITRHFIVLKNELFIVLWTNYHKYIKTYKNSRISPIESDGRKKFYCVAMFLNYCFFDQYKVRCLNDITVEMAESFLKDYALCKLPDDDEYTHRTDASIDQCVAHIIDFIDNYSRKNPKSKIKPSMLFKEVEVFSQNQKKLLKKKVPLISVQVKDYGQSEILLHMTGLQHH